MAEILLATVFLFGAALIVSVVRSSLRTQRLLKALERGERTPELKAVVDAARKRARSRSGIAPSTDLNDGMKKLMAEADELTRQGRFDEAARHRFDHEFKEELARWEIRSK